MKGHRCVKCNKEFRGNRRFCTSFCYNEYNKTDITHVTHTEPDTHNLEKPFNCVICKANFKTESMLNQHTLFEHETYRPYCGTDISSRNDEIVNHIRVKIDSLMFRCELQCTMSNEETCDWCTMEFVKLTQFEIVQGKKPYKKRMPNNRHYCKRCGILKWKTKERWLSDDPKILARVTSYEMAVLLRAWNWLEENSLLFIFEKRYKFVGVVNGIFKHKDYDYIASLERGTSVERELGIKPIKANEKLRMWINHKSLRDVGFTKEMRWVSDQIYGENSDHLVNNNNRINTIKLMYFNEEQIHWKPEKKTIRLDEESK